MVRSAEIDRKTASGLLKVSIRTIDRYIRSGRLSARYDRGRILIDRKEIERISSLQTILPKQEEREFHEMPMQENRPIGQRPDIERHSDFYRELYQEAQATLREYQKELREANFKINELESKIMRMPQGAFVHDTHSYPEPLRNDASHVRTEIELDSLKKNFESKEKEIGALKTTLQKEQLNRSIFALLTYLLLALMPLFWFLVK